MSAHEMALLLDEDPMSVDGSIQGIQGIDDMGGMEGIEGMDGIEDMGAMATMGSAMALDDVDLFGDPVMDGVGALAVLPSRPLPSMPLQQRLDELRARGCCQAITWSRQGTIASLSKDAMSVELRSLRCNPDTTDWELSEPTTWSPPSQTPLPPSANPPAPVPLASAVAPFVHLAWAPTQNPDLAVVDALGRITILSFHITVNQTYPVRRWDTDVVDDLHAVVGCYWLALGMPPNKQARPSFLLCTFALAGLSLLTLSAQYHLIHGPATKHQSEYRYEHQLYPAFGPYHPNPAKSAFLCVTTNGSLKLFFTQNNARLEETAIELESVTSSDDLITHASLCSDKREWPSIPPTLPPSHAVRLSYCHLTRDATDTLLIALATASKQLRVVRVIIQWGLPQVDKQVPPGSVPLRPSLRESHVAVTSWIQHGPGESPLDGSMAQLSHIEILPSAPAGPSQPMAPPVVLTVRSYVPQDAASYHQDSQSIIDRWEVVSDQTQSLHQAFQQLGAKNGAAPAAPVRVP